MTERWRLALLFLAATFVYANTLFNDFAQDDEIYILQNHAVTAHSVRQWFEPNYFSRVFRPLTFASFSANWALSGPRAFTYHLVNILLHGAVVCLLYLLLRILLAGSSASGVISFVTALFFAFHPLHTEAAASIAGRSELLAALFLLAAWLFHLRDRHFLSLACFILALLSKESAVVFLPLIVLCDFVRNDWKSLRRYAAVAAITVAYAAALWKLQGGRLGAVIPFLDNPLAVLPAHLRILNALRVAWKYIGLHFFPAAFSCDYSYNAISLYSNWRLLPAAIAFVFLLACWIWLLWKRQQAFGVALTLYLAGFAATANIFFPIGTIMGERLAYLPSAGICLLLALAWLPFREWNRTLAIVLLSAVLSLLAVRTFLRNRDWRDNFTLYSAALKVVPGSAKIHHAIALQLASRGQFDSARQEFHIALQIYPEYPEALEALGLLEANTGHDQQARHFLEAALSKAQKGSLNYNYAVVNLAGELLKLKENEKALQLLDEVVRDSPGYARAWANRAVVYYQSGLYQQARSDAQTALRLDPANTQALTLMALLQGVPASPPQN